MPVFKEKKNVQNLPIYYVRDLMFYSASSSIWPNRGLPSVATCRPWPLASIATAESMAIAKISSNVDRKVVVEY